MGIKNNKLEKDYIKWAYKTYHGYRPGFDNWIGNIKYGHFDRYFQDYKTGSGQFKRYLNEK